MRGEPPWSYPVIVPYKIGNIYIEPTNHCNLRCEMCPHSKVKIKKGFMDWGLFLKIVDDILSYNPKTFIQLFYIGESLLHPRILDMVAHLKRNNFRVHLATNATVLNEKIAKGLIVSGLDFITFSFDGADKESYESIRRGANYGNTLNNILSFLRLKNDMKGKTHTVLEIIEMNSTKNKIPSFVERFNKLSVDEIKIKPFLGWAGTIDHRKLAVNPPGKPDLPCNRPWRMLAVTWDGLFLPCCVDAERKCVVGNVQEDSIEEVWNNKKMQSIRNELKNKNYNKIKLCENCKDMQVLSQRFTFPRDK